MPTARELTINNTASATALAQNIFGQGTVVNSATITGQDVQSGIYTGANTTLGSIAPSDSGVILSTGKVADFTNSSGSTNTNTSASTSTNNNGAGYSPLDAITGQATKDAVVLKINFTPTGDYITMQFVFSSEEYLEYVNGGVNDAFGVWVNGSYVPFTPADNDLVSIDTINSTNASNLYLDNPRSADTYNTEMDGLTVTLSIKAPVISGEPNTMVIALADSGDSLYDTNVLISANSIQTIALAFDDNVTMEANTQIIVDVLDNDTDSTNSGLTITEINGISIVVGQTVTVPTGESITLNADGTITIKNDGDIGSQTFTYAVIDGAGNTDVGFVTVNTVKDTPLNYIVEGGAGDDVINTSYTGDPQGDKIDNSDHSDGSNNDSITAGDGNDQVTSGLGDDTIDAGNGNDFVNAGSGDDTVFGGNGNDMIVGGSGNDQIYGGSGDDLIFGGSGNDTIDGGLGADIIDAGIGDDDITFFNGDNIYGGAGNDTFNASEFGDTTTSAITIAGGNDDESPKGDTLKLGKLSDLSTLVKNSDGINASGNETFSGSVTMDDGTLLTYSEIEYIICFTPGARIATPRGARDIATLRVGDLVVTRDHGLQPIRWIQQRTVPATDSFAPIRIRPGAVIGQDRDLLVSPQHRMLFHGYRAELLFGESEVLVSAKHLVDGIHVTRETGGTVTYIHMMFDEHEVVYAEGAATESFHPGELGLAAISDPARDELFELFPQLRSNPTGYGQTARRCLKAHESDLLVR